MGVAEHHVRRRLGLVPGGVVLDLRTEDAPGRPVHVVPRHPSLGQRRRQVDGALLLERLLHVQPGAQRLRGVPQPPDEVGHGHAGETPRAAQHAFHQPLVLARPLTVDRVVLGHDAGHAGLDDPPEMRQVHLVQGRVVSGHVDREPGVLHRVERVVLGHRHRVALHRAGQRRPEPAQQDRVLAVRLLRPSPGRMPRQVDADATEEVRALGTHLPADRRADPFLQRDVPGGAAGHRHRERGRFAHHHAARAVGEQQARNAQPVDPAHRIRPAVVPVADHVRHRLPEREVTVEQPEPLLAGQLCHQVLGGGIGRAAGPHGGDGIGESGHD